MVRARMSRLVWVSDVHLNFVDARTRQELYGSIGRAEADGLLVGGDVGEAANLARFLQEMAAELPGLPIYFVLGNHDFYGSTIELVRKAMRELTARSGQMIWLTGSSSIELGGSAALIGDDGWADGRLGDYQGSSIILNDYLQIGNFISRLQLLNQLGDEAAARVDGKLQDCCSKGARTIVFLTHVPPFLEACWHEGRLSDDDWAPHFTCKAIGDVLVSVMDRNPEVHLTVLCGHTHSPGVAQVRPNILVKTAAAEYGRPRIQEILDIP
jgi:3',5'-cyclic-AMP phosphodiesterase